MLRNPLLEGIGLVPVECFCVLNKNPAGVELAQWRLFCNFQRTHGGLVLPMENKGTPYVMSVFSSPMRVRAATWVSGDTWCCVLLHIGPSTSPDPSGLWQRKSMCARRHLGRPHPTGDCTCASPSQPSRLRRAGPHLRSATRKTPQAERTRGPGRMRALPRPPSHSPGRSPLPDQGRGWSKCSWGRPGGVQTAQPESRCSGQGRPSLCPPQQPGPGRVRAICLCSHRGMWRCWSTRSGCPRTRIWSATTVTLPRNLENQSLVTAGRP